MIFSQHTGTGISLLTIQSTHNMLLPTWGAHIVCIFFCDRLLLRWFGPSSSCGSFLTLWASRVANPCLLFSVHRDCHFLSHFDSHF